jgi:serine/threonine-protein kinase
MTHLSDVAITHLRGIVEHPDIGARYEIRACIGEGGMGAVYLAHDRTLDREVALKLLRDIMPTAEQCERLAREARILASLEHPGIVPVHDVGTLSDGRVFYVMKRVRGERFDDFARGRRTRAELLRAFLQMCDAVAFAHSSGVVHRDLKPQNVMLGAFGEVLVLDWGVASTRSFDRRNGADENVASTAVGTPGYMAPEQLRGAADERSDIFGLGGILFTRNHPVADVETAKQWPGELAPAPLRAICERARAVDPAKRYQTVSELAVDVANYLDALPVAAHAEGIVERLRRIAIRHRTAILLVAAYLVMRVALLIFARR